MVEPFHRVPIYQSNDIPTTRCRTQIYNTTRLGQEIELLVQLNQLKRGTRAITLLFGHMIVFIQPPFGGLLIATHGGVKILYGRVYRKR